MNISGAKAMVECLKAENVGLLFCYPGAAICPFLDELNNSDIRQILVRHEVNAGHAASGYARITGRAGVCCATSGPGATNLITAIATAHQDSIPLIIITGQVSVEQIGRDVFQEADITGAAEPFVKHSYLIKNVEDIPEAFKRAFYIAESGRPGPVLIDMPFDVQHKTFDFSYPDEVNIRSYKPSSAGNKLQIKRVCQALAEAKRPLICAGGGLFFSGGDRLMRELAERCDIPVITTLMGVGSIPTEHRLCFGMLGVFGDMRANKAIEMCDLLVIFGARVGDRAVASLSTLDSLQVIHIDIDPAEIGKNVKVNIPVVGDVAVILRQILEQVKKSSHSEWIEKLLAMPAAAIDVVTENGFVNPAEFIQKLNKYIKPDTVVVSDVGQNQIWTVRNLKLKGGRYLTAGGMGTMGYSLPAAIGAKLASPKSDVITICGDGSFEMMMNELATAVQSRINIKIVVMRNRVLGMIKELQENLYGGRLTDVDLSGSPDYVRIVEAYGLSGEEISEISEAEGAIKRMMSAEKPYIIVVDVSENEGT